MLDDASSIANLQVGKKFAGWEGWLKIEKFAVGKGGLPPLGLETLNPTEQEGVGDIEA